MTNFFRRHWIEISLITMMGLYFLVFLYLSFAKYDFFFSGFRDLGIYDQIVYNTSRGDLFLSTLDIVRQTQNNALGLHTEFILLPLALIYKLFPDPKVLLFTQTIVLSLGALPVYLIAKKILRNARWTLIFPLCFLLFPAFEWANLFELHPLTLVITPFLLAFYFAIHGRYLWYAIFIFLSLLVREDVGLMVASLGVYLFFTASSRKLAFLTVVTGLGWFLLMSRFVIGHYAAGTGSPALSYYEVLGKSYGEVIKNLFNPGISIPLLLRKQNIIFLIQLFLPLGFISILGWRILFVSLPQFLLLLLASKPEMQLINFHYSVFLIPFIFIATIYGTKVLANRGTPLKVVACLILFFSLFSNFLSSPSPLSRRFEKPPYMDPVKAEKISQVLKTIPQEASLMTTQRLGSHLSQRKEIYMFPEKINEVDYIVLNTFEFENRPWLIAIYPERQEEVVEIADQLRQDQNYETLEDRDGIIVFRKKKQ